MDKIGCDVICKSHSARSDRDQYRICPTKLTKPELEHLYFALLENNLELKKTVNGQQDKIKVLSTKMQRMSSAQKVLRAEEKKDCCVATKAVVNQQKEIVTELKRANERMADRIRKLNMRLCSAKQFCKSATPRCLRCSTATSPYLIKHSSSSYKQHSQSTLKFAVSCQNLSREPMITKCVQTESLDATKNKDDKPCEDNKCKTLLDELKQKIENLREELSRTQNEGSSRLSTLEAELQDARADHVRGRAQRVAAEHELVTKDKRIADLIASLRAAEALSTELKMQLSIEKRKVAELETQLKAATMSNRVTQTIEDTLTSIQESNKSTATDVTLTCACSPRSHAADNTQRTTSAVYGDESKLSKHTDDSGFMDANKSQSLLDDQSLNKIIEELTNRIVVLQTQVDALTISPPEIGTLESRAKTRDDHYTTTDEHSNVATEIESLQPGLKTNVLSPTNTTTQQTKNTSEEKPIPITITETVIQEAETTSPEHHYHDIRTSSPIDNPGPAERAVWKTGVAKLNVLTKITTETHEKAKENIGNDSSNNAGISDERNERDEEFEDESISIEDKTYNVPDKDKDVAESSKKAVENDINKDKDIKSAIEEAKTIAKVDEKEVENDKALNKIIANETDQENNITEALGKDDNHKIDKNVTNSKKQENATEKDKIVRKDSNKSSKKDKSSGKKHIDSPKRKLKEKEDIDLNEKAMAIINKTKAHKSVEQKTPVARTKRLIRAQTEIHTESTGDEATYTVDKSADDSSPDNTDCEISSMTDLPEEREPKSPISKHRLSPGEQRYTSTGTESVASPSTNFSLSEGEIPITSARRRSNEDKIRTEHGMGSTVPKMEETLQAITDELARCKRLLFSQRSYDSAIPSVIRNENKSPNNSSAPRWASTS